MSPSPSFHKLITVARKLAFLPPKPISPRKIKEQDAPLCRIPLELRQMLWEAYYGGRAVHIFPGRKRDYSRECVKWDADDASPGPHTGVCSRSRIWFDRISLLLTCKKIYFECIHTLYRETLFDFSHSPYALARLPKHLPVHTVHLTQVNLTWEQHRPIYPPSKKPSMREVVWQRVWVALAAMEGLEWLRVELYLANPFEGVIWTENEWCLWPEVRRVTRPSHWELILPFAANAETREETLPCTITRKVVDLDALRRRLGHS